MVDTLALSASDERIAEISGAAEADGSVVSLTIRARFTIGVGSARVRVAKITLVERTAAVEWMSSVALGARANGLVALDTTLGANAASSCARVDALEIEASLVATAILVLRALGEAARKRIAQEVGRARANGPVVSNVAVGISAASSARIGTAEADARPARVALGIGLAFTTAALDGIAHPSV